MFKKIFTTSFCFVCQIASAFEVYDQLTPAAPLLEEAIEYQQAGLYDQAILRLQTAVLNLGAPEDLTALIEVRNKLAQCFLQQNKYLEALEELNRNIRQETSSNEQQEEQGQSLYLKAYVYLQMKQYALAEEAYEKYLNQSGFQKFKATAIFDKGLAAAHQDKYAKAQSLFLEASQLAADSDQKLLAKIYVARMDVALGQNAAAEKKLQQLAKEVSNDEMLTYEIAYFRGEAAFQMQNYLLATQFFEQSIPKHIEKCSWKTSSLYRLGCSYLKINEDPQKSTSELEHNFNHAETALKELISLDPSEKTYLTLGQCYIARAKRLNEEKSYLLAESILSRQDIFKSNEGKAHALLLRADTALAYTDRERLYRLLTLEENKNSSLYAKGWYKRALNDLEHSLELSAKTEDHIPQDIFKRAADTFHLAYEQLKSSDKILAFSALKYQILALSHAQIDNGDTLVFELLERYISENPLQQQQNDNSEEIWCLHGFFAARLADRCNAGVYTPIAIKSLSTAASYGDGKYQDQALSYLGALHYRQGNYTEAEYAYLRLTELRPASQLSGEAWLWSALCAERLNKDPKISKERRLKAFENFPDSPFAAAAYFTFYSYQDYLQGNRSAIKHLQAFIDKHPETPYLIEAYFLLGLDHKRDRKTPEGKWIAKKSLTEAIDAFQEAEALYDHFIEKRALPEDLHEYYAHLRLRAVLERALANLAIADESQGAKKQIYLEYAEEVFKLQVSELQKLETSMGPSRFSANGFGTMFEESAFGLAQTYIKAQNDAAAKQILTMLLNRWQQAKVTKSYYLSRVLYEQGKLLLKEHQATAALQSFRQAEEAGKGNFLSTDQKLDLWIQQSFAYDDMHQYDNALLILSKVVNDDAVSSLRMKAMYLRAEVYEKQGRTEQARKQLDSMSKKGGMWAMKAKEKLEKDYGY